ncbi:hypothetical protein HAX54_005473, partial [Datura stramonium]|nr:hypothetical protein [Datura stramonium]
QCGAQPHLHNQRREVPACPRDAALGWHIDMCDAAAVLAHCQAQGALHFGAMPCATCQGRTSASSSAHLLDSQRLITGEGAKNCRAQTLHSKKNIWVGSVPEIVL